MSVFVFNAPSSPQPSALRTGQRTTSTVTVDRFGGFAHSSAIVAKVSITRFNALGSEVEVEAEQVKTPHSSAPTVYQHQYAIPQNAPEGQYRFKWRFEAPGLDEPVLHIQEFQVGPRGLAGDIEFIGVE